MESDMEELTKARPYLRSAVALLIYLRHGIAAVSVDVAWCYLVADDFLDRLVDDVSGAKEIHAAK